MWTPIIPKAGVEERVGAIARTLKAHSDLNPEQAGLLVGRAGLALFFLYYARFTGDPADKAYSDSFVERLFASLPETMPFTYCSGLAGVAWLLRHAQQQGLVEVDADAALSDADDMLRSRMVAEMREGRFDFLHAALGCAWYFLDQPVHPESHEALARLVGELERHAQAVAPSGESRRSAVAWANTLPGMDEAPGTFNLGMAHGLPGVISVLEGLVRRGIEAERCTELLERSMSFLLDCQAPPGAAFCFPARTNEATSRLAWCYGDPGVAVALWQAGRTFERPEWSRVALEVIEHAATRRLQADTGVRDASLCHGSAGLALIFARMSDRTRSATLRDAARHWLDDAMARGSEPAGYAGYRAYVGDQHADAATELSVLNGIAGVGLMLISAGRSIAPDWDRALLLS